MQGSRKKQHKNISSNLMELPELCMELSHASYPFERRLGLGKSWDGFTLSAMAALCSMPLNCFCRLSSRMVKKPQLYYADAQLSMASGTLGVKTGRPSGPVLPFHILSLAFCFVFLIWNRLPPLSTPASSSPGLPCHNALAILSLVLL